jgi:hypothetical protein
MYTIEECAIVFGVTQRYTFDDYIAEAIPFDDAIVVRLENQGWKRTNENVLAIDYNGRLLWRIKARVHAFAESHYVNIYRRNENVDIYNWDGTILTIFPKTGEIMSESMVYSAERRVSSHRRFI